MLFVLLSFREGCGADGHLHKRLSDNPAISNDSPISLTAGNPRIILESNGFRTWKSMTSQLSAG